MEYSCLWEGLGCFSEGLSKTKNRMVEVLGGREQTKLEEMEKLFSSQRR